VYASGFPRTDGLCADPSDSALFQVGTRADAPADPINQLAPGGDYGWPAATGATRQPVALLPRTSRAPGGCAVLNHVLYTTTLDGRSLLAADVTAGAGGRVKVGPFAVRLRNRYGRLRTVVAAADGALWLTTSNLDGRGKPVADDERVLRVVPSGGGGGSSPL
jgi:glucose/arabinose dehydrogenase